MAKSKCLFEESRRVWGGTSFLGYKSKTGLKSPKQDKPVTQK